MSPYQPSSKIVKLTLYSFFLFTLVPLFIGLAIPTIYAPEEVGGYDTQLLEKLFSRAIMLSSTGMVISIISIIFFALLSKLPFIQKLYTFLLLPLCLIAESTQLIMYREFGQEINLRLLDLFQADLPTLWKYGCREYHLDVFILLTFLSSALLTQIITNPRKYKFFAYSHYLSWGAGLFCLFLGAFGVALRTDISDRPIFHPEKTSLSPIFQLADLTINLSHMKGSGYQQILLKTQPLTKPTLKEEIDYRLQSPHKAFISQTSHKPDWLKKKPAHIFMFLLESFGYGLLDEPDLVILTPNLNQFSKEGLSTPFFFAAGDSTISAVHSIHSGVSPIDPYRSLHHPTPKTISRFPLTTLPFLMKKCGYTPLFYAGSHRKFWLKGDISEAYGYDQFIGCADVAPDIKSNEWGVSDGDFFKWAEGQVSHLKIPHFITFLNVSNHPPFDAPTNSIQIPEIPSRTLAKFRGTKMGIKKNYAQHVYYADHQVGEMVKFLNKTYPHSLFIFIGDHNCRNIPNPHRDRVPFILWNPDILGSPNTHSWFGSQMDTLATMANLLLPENSQFTSLGRPVWDQNQWRISLTTKHFVTATGQINVSPNLHGENEATFENQTNLPPESLEKILLKASAIEALSWGYLNSKPIPE